MVKKCLLTLFFIISTFWAKADSWALPKITVTYSQNKEYMLRVYPTELLYTKSAPKEIRKLRKQMKKAGIFDESLYRIPSHAILYHIYGSDTTEIWDKPLVNISAPISAIVANDGKSVVTLDDWGSIGYRHSIVIYGKTGELIKDFSLEDISPFPVKQYYHTVSSRYWGSHAEYLDNNRVEIRFRNEKGEEKAKIFNIAEEAFEDSVP